jgi:hypothetical protein
MTEFQELLKHRRRFIGNHPRPFAGYSSKQAKIAWPTLPLIV